MKKPISLAITVIMLISCFAVPVTADAADNEIKLPFELVPAKTVAMSKVSEGDATDIKFQFSMEADMIKFMQDCEDSEKKEALMNELGVDDLWINAQIDWAIDDKNDWHHNEFWDDNEATRYFGLGYDKDGHSRTCEWDVLELLLYPQATNDCWITRWAGNPLDSEDTVWNGETFEDSVHRPGMKDVLKDNQYTIVENEPGDGHIVINYDEHTLYARMRYYVTVRTTDYDYRLFSDWSDTAVYGKDAPKWTPPTADTLEAPVISDLYETGEEFNDYPIVGYTLAVSDELNTDLTEITARGGYMRIYTEARVKGSDKWNELQGDIELKGGTLYSDILAICGEGKPVPKGTEIEFRARYFCEIKLEYTGEVVDEFYSPYSEVLTVTFGKDYGPEPQTVEPEKPAPAEPVIKNLDDGASKTQVEKFITGLKSDSDPKGTTFGLLSAKQKKVTKNAITISWNKLKGAKTYVIYGNKCGKTNRYKFITTVSSTSYTQKKLKSGTYYKYLVTAFDKKGKSIAAAKTLHIATTGGKAGNFAKVTTSAKKDKVTLAKKGKTFKLNAKAVAASKKLKVSVHRKMQYESSNAKIAAVSSKGVITAKKKGTCYIYAYAQSGAFKKIKVTVKK